MASIEERLKLKRGQVDTWSTKEKLSLASCVLKCGNQNWMSVSRNLKMFAGEPGRPPDWFSQKSCAVQYDSLLDRVETPKRKKRGADGTKSEGSDISPGESIVKQLVAERIDEIKKLMAEVKLTYLKNKEENYLLESGQADDRLNEFLLQIQEEKRQKEKEQEAHQKWLKEREERKQEMEQAWRPFASPQHTRGAVGGATGGSQTPTPGSRPVEARRRPSNQSEISEPDSNIESPLSVEIGGEETVEVNTAPTPTSPLLTSLLKSPSQAQSSSILHSAITSQRGASPTITSLLNSSPSIPNNSGSASPNIKALVTNALASRVEEGPKSVCHTASGSPTLSMLLELPPSVPGQPLPALPSAAAVTSSAAGSTPVPVATTPVKTLPLDAAPVVTPETATVSQPGEVKTDALPDISAMDLMMPVESEANIAEAERGLNIETADLQHLSHADLELVMDPIDMVLGEGDISLVEEMAVLIEVSSDEVSSSVNSVLDMNSKDAMAVAAQAQKLQAEAEAQLQAAAVTSTPMIPRVVLSETSEVVTPTIHLQTSPEEATPITPIENQGTPKKQRPVARKIDLEVVPEETPVVPIAPVEELREEAIEEMTELSEAGEEIETFVEPKPEDVMRTVGLSKEALENASIVIIQDDGEVVKMSDVVQEKVETEEVEHKDNVEVVTTEEVVESVPVAIDEISVSSDTVEESVVQIEETPVTETSGPEEKVEVDSDREETIAKTKVTRNSRDTEVEKNDEVRRNSVRNSEKEVLPILTLDALKEDQREIILEADANDESTLDKIHLLVEEETRKNEAKDMICGDDFESANEDKDGLDDTPLKDLVETYGEEKSHKNADKLRRDELRSSRDSTKGSRPRRNSKREKSPDLAESSNDAVDEISSEKRESSRKERNISSSQESDKSDGKKSESVSLKKDETSRKERKTSSSQESDKSDGKKSESVSLKKDETSRKERKTSSSQESDKSEGRKSETVSLKREEKERRREEDIKLEDEQDKTSVGKGADLAEATDDSSRPGDSDKESSVKYEKTRSETPSTEDDKTSDIEQQSTRSSSARRGRSGRDYSDSVPSSPASTQAITDEEKDYRAWKKSIMLVYGRIAAHKSASLFLRPITDDKAPGYSQMIYRPMDLFTMKKNIENGVIRTTAEFQRDVLLMFNNAIMYNKSGSHVHEMASAMQEEGVQILKEFVNTQLLLQAVGSDAPNVPSRRGTRTAEKRDLDGDKSSTPKAGSSAVPSTNTPGSTQIQAGKRKRSLVPEEARAISKRRKADDA